MSFDRELFVTELETPRVVPVWPLFRVYCLGGPLVENSTELLVGDAVGAFEESAGAPLHVARDGTYVVHGEGYVNFRLTLRPSVGDFHFDSTLVTLPDVRGRRVAAIGRFGYRVKVRTVAPDCIGNFLYVDVATSFANIEHATS